MLFNHVLDSFLHTVYSKTRHMAMDFDGILGLARTLVIACTDM